MVSKRACSVGRFSMLAGFSASVLGGCGAESGSLEDPSLTGESAGQTSEGLSGFAVTTRAYNIQRTGANTSETALTPSNVNVAGFAKLFTITVDDQVYAQPLYGSNVSIGGGTHNVVFIATVNNTVYAFDADFAGAGNPVAFWSRNFNNGGRPPNHNDVGSGQFCNPYNDFSGNIGIVGTPVIDAAANTLFVVTRTIEGGVHRQRLRALDLFTGNEKVGAATIGTINSQTNNQRAALALSQGKVYVAWSSHCDLGPYEGRVISFNTSNLSQANAFSAAPGNGQAGIWMAGAGPAIDGSGNLIYVTGNGTFNGSTSFGETVLRLSPTLSRVSSFTPANVTDLNNGDLDLGSSGPVFVPGTSRLVFGGKGGGNSPFNDDTKCYSVDANNMGGGAQIWTCVGNPNNPDEGGAASNVTHHLHGSMVAWQSPSGTNVYSWGETDVGSAWRLNGSTFNTTAIMKTTVAAPAGMPGGMISLSANGSSNGILWAAMPLSQDANHMTVRGVLRAFDANNLANEIWSSRRTVNPSNDTSVDDPQNFTKGSAPVIANGKVYVPSLSNRVSVYGLATSREAEDPSLSPTFTAGLVGRVFDDTNASHGQGFILESHANGQFVSFTMNVPQAGLYGVRPRHKPSNNRGIWQLSIDGVNQGAAVDGFSSGVSYLELDLGTKQLSAGNHTFRFTVTGRNGGSTDSWIALDYIKLARRN